MSDVMEKRQMRLITEDGDPFLDSVAAAGRQDILRAPAEHARISAQANHAVVRDGGAHEDDCKGVPGEVYLVIRRIEGVVDQSPHARSVHLQVPRRNPVPFDGIGQRVPLLRDVNVQ
jgi:hypothetical protein